jgi:hypothetical protein
VRGDAADWLRARWDAERRDAASRFAAPDGRPEGKLPRFRNRVLGTNHSASYNVLPRIIHVFLPGLLPSTVLQRPSLPDLPGPPCKRHMHETHAQIGRTADRLVPREFGSLNLFYCGTLLYSATQEITVILALLGFTKQIHCDALLAFG